MNKEFWSGKRVFLTGHTGFKGSWLSLWLQTLGAEVTGFALNPPTNPSLFDAADVGGGMQSVIGDIRDYSALQNAINKVRPEIVIHMAAQPLVRYSYDNPVETYSTNVMGTVHLLEAVRKSKSVKAVVNVTSDKCYENNEWVWGYRENEPMGGYDPYSNSKGCAELVTSAYRSSFMNPEAYSQHGIALASARAGNVIGGGDWATDRLVPDIIRSIVEGHGVKIRSPNAIRPWQHVLEPLSGYLLLAEMLYKEGVSFAEAWNFGPDDSDTKTVQSITEKLVNGWGGSASYFVDALGASHHEAAHLKLDCSKAKMRLQWSPRWSLDQALNKIIEWHKAHNAQENMREKTLNQINDYQKNYKMELKNE